MIDAANGIFDQVTLENADLVGNGCIPDQAVDGDRVLVQPAVYHESIDFKGKAIEVIGLAGPLATTIDAGFSASAVRTANRSVMPEM